MKTPTCPNCINKQLIDVYTYQGDGYEIPQLFCESCEYMVDADDYYMPDYDALIKDDILDLA